MVIWSLLACADGPFTWIDGSFEPDVVAHARRDPTFPLDGAHVTVPCHECHGSGEPDAEVPSTCLGCHSEDAPEEHPDSRGCGTCHTSDAWEELLPGDPA